MREYGAPAPVARKLRILVHPLDPAGYIWTSREAVLAAWGVPADGTKAMLVVNLTNDSSFRASRAGLLRRFAPRNDRVF